MPYHRDHIFDSATIQWQTVTLSVADDAWSDEYRVDSARLLVPLTLGFTCALAGKQQFCDPQLALWLHPQQPYRLRRPWAGQRNMLITLADAGVHPGWARVPLSLHLRLAQWQTRWRAQQLEALQLEESLLLLAHELLPPAAAPRTPRRAVTRAREYLAAHGERNDSLAQIAGAAHCSAFHLARLFVCETGQTIHRYRTQLRMLKALACLQQGQRDIAALALDLGYANHSHFSAVFGRWFGVAPHQMRKNLTALPMIH
ncbi:MAG: helix-turn-helix transcriptional regulator [Burkholderiaceae bacterium]